MDRYEVPIDEHLAPLVEAAEQGKEVVIVRDGEVVGAVTSTPAPVKPKVIDDDFLARMTAWQERIRALGVQPFDAADAIRKMRDEAY